MITPCTSVRLQYSRHQGTSYRVGSSSVILVWPQRNARRYQGSASGSAGSFERFSVANATRSAPASATVTVPVRFKNERRDSPPGPGVEPSQDRLSIEFM